MRLNRRALGILAIAIAATGCYYQSPTVRKTYDKVQVGMSQEKVIKAIGQPTAILENEMFYIYDDPEDPVRLRFVLNSQGVVAERYYESKKDLAKKAEETKGELPPLQPLPEEEPRAYPGGPIKRFEKKPAGGY